MIQKETLQDFTRDMMRMKNTDYSMVHILFLLAFNILINNKNDFYLQINH